MARKDRPLTESQPSIVGRPRPSAPQHTSSAGTRAHVRFFFSFALGLRFFFCAGGALTRALFVCVWCSKQKQAQNLVRGKTATELRGMYSRNSDGDLDHGKTTCTLVPECLRNGIDDVNTLHAAIFLADAQSEYSMCPNEATKKRSRRSKGELQGH